MSLSLLANYGSSSESESDSEEITVSKPTNNTSIKTVIGQDGTFDKKKETFPSASNSNKKLSSLMPPPKNSTSSLFSNLGNSNNKKHSLFSQLPNPKKRKETQPQNNPSNTKKYISLIGPLEDDDDDDEETAELKREIEEERRRKLGGTGSGPKSNVETGVSGNGKEKKGLFSLLPAPQNTNKKDEEKTKKSNSTFGMIPLSLKKKEEKKKKEEQAKLKKKAEAAADEEEEEEKVTDDFFSLDTPSKIDDNELKETTSKSDLNSHDNSENNNNNNNTPSTSIEINTNPEVDNTNTNYSYDYNYSQTYDPNSYQYPQKPGEAYTNYDYSNYYNQYYYPEAGASDSNFNNNILKLQEMGEFQMGEIKEINQKDQISNVYEVERTKQISKSNQPSINFKGISKDFKPSFKQKSKHNIMYLAYQAKAKETELLEANLQRKANRKISGRKYGF